MARTYKHKEAQARTKSELHGMVDNRQGIRRISREYMIENIFDASISSFTGDADININE